jgi:hypothetical protein
MPSQRLKNIKDTKLSNTEEASISPKMLNRMQEG